MHSKINTYLDLIEAAEMAAQMGKEGVEDLLLEEADRVWYAMNEDERAEASHTLRVGR